MDWDKLGDVFTSLPQSLRTLLRSCGSGAVVQMNQTEDGDVYLQHYPTFEMVGLPGDMPWSVLFCLDGRTLLVTDITGTLSSGCQEDNSGMSPMSRSVLGTPSDPDWQNIVQRAVDRLTTDPPPEPSRGSGQ